LTFGKILHPYITGSFIRLGKSIHNALNTRLGETPNQSEESSDENENRNYMIYFLTAIWLTPGGSSTVHIYTQTIHRTTQLTQTIHRTKQLTNCEECGPCPVFASYTLAFVLQLRKKHGKTSVRIAKECQLARWKRNAQNRTMHLPGYEPCLTVSMLIILRTDSFSCCTL